MATHKAKIVISHEVWKIIEWFTYNFKTEIGAMGNAKLVEDKNGKKYFYVDKLFFPKQEVTGATVKFTPEMWGDLLKEHGLDGLKDIAFYWHRHPGNSAHSGTDDEDTFETFMSKEAERPFFCFLQTAVGTNGWNDEARIDIRRPVRYTITDKDIDLRVESSPETIALKAECEAIAEKVIVKKPPVTQTITSRWNRGTGHGNCKIADVWAPFEDSVLSYGGYVSLNIAVREAYFGEIHGTDYFNNAMLDGQPTKAEEALELTFTNGGAEIEAGSIFARNLEKVLNDKKSNLNKVVRNWKEKDSGFSKSKKYSLQPVRKEYAMLKAHLIRAYLTFNEALLKKIDSEKDERTLEITVENIANEDAEVKDTNTIYPTEEQDEHLNYVTISGKADVTEIIADITDECRVQWINGTEADVYDVEDSVKVGTLYTSDHQEHIVVQGTQLISILDDIKYVKEDEDRLEAEEEEEEEEDLWEQEDDKEEKLETDAWDTVDKVRKEAFKKAGDRKAKKEAKKKQQSKDVKKAKNVGGKKSAK